ncbi:uncharacterized protein LOC103502092 isoform X3 [Cucumis melo]|uniref:S-acyltransferase n=1 Tax=Cucumis melo TaxID=3656 RepID=A0ABM3KC99_CUCME|nr:uncharacterized protein LOC103502092 isoform X3 [Cucumis melo]
MAGSHRPLHSLSNTCFAYSKHPISCSSLLLRFVLLHSTPTFSYDASNCCKRCWMVQAASSSPLVCSGVRFLQCTFCLAGLHSFCSTRMLFSDPGLVSHNPSPSDAIPQSLVLEIDTHHQDIGLGDRLRCCPICKTYVKGFDHHCPAFGNCIGHKNYVLFMVLLFGFIWTEATYITCLSQYSAESELLDGDGARLEVNFSRKVARSTMLFSILQLVWQVAFFSWHVYCICFNIRTDEWIHWKRYPEFQIVVQSEQGQRSSEMKFRNPYDKGILQNVKEFMVSKQ